MVLSFSNVISGVKSGPLISNVIRTYPAVYIPYDEKGELSIWDMNSKKWKSMEYEKGIFR